MANVRLVAKNSTYLILESVITRLLEFVILVFFLIKFLPQNEFGYYNWIIGYLNLFAIFIDFGMISILEREIARDNSRSSLYMGTGLTFGVMMSITLVLSSSLFYILIRPSEFSDFSILNVIVAAPFILFSSKIKSFRKMIDVMYTVKYRFIYIVIFNILGRVIFLVWLWWIFRHGYSFIQVMAAMAFCDFPGFVIMFLLYFKFFPRPKFGIEKTVLFSILKKSYPLLLGVIFLVINIQISKIIIPFFMTAEDNAVFSVAAMIPQYLGIIPVALMAPVGPLLSKKYIENIDAFMNIYGIVVKFFLYISIPVVLYFFFYMDEIINLIVMVKKLEYAGSALPAKVLIFSQIFIFLSIVFYSTLVYSDRQKYELVFHIISGSLNILLNIILIPFFGVVGASIAVAISYGIFLPVSLLIKNTRFLSIIIYKKIPKPFISSTAIIIVFLIFGNNIFIQIPVGIICYLAILFLIKGFDEKDKEVFYELIGRH